VRNTKYLVEPRVWIVRSAPFEVGCSLDENGLPRRCITKMWLMGNRMATHVSLSTKSRSVAIDAVRVVGIVAIVAGHVGSGGIMRPLVYTWHVPLFFLLVGYFWSADRTFSAEIRNRFRSIVLPALFWGLTILGLYTILRMTVPSVQDDLLPMPAYLAYWFVPVLFLVCILLRLLCRLPSWVPWMVAVSGMAVATVAGSILAESPGFIGLVLPSLFFVIVGRTIRKHRRRLSLLHGIGLLVLAAGLISFGVSGPLDMKAGDMGTPILSVLVAVMISVALIVISEAILAGVPLSVSPLISQLAVSGWAVVLGHAAVIYAMRPFSVPHGVTFLVALTVPWAIAMVALRTRFAMLVTGSMRLGR
jgi:acyltransferase